MVQIIFLVHQFENNSSNITNNGFQETFQNLKKKKIRKKKKNGSYGYFEALYIYFGLLLFLVLT